MNKKFWSGRRVLLTGHTGFKGAWLSIWLNEMGAHVTGVSLAPTSSPNLFDLANIELFLTNKICDICDLFNLTSIINEVQPEIIFHFAAQSIVRTSYTDPITTFNTNIIGTVNILESARQCNSVKVVVAITTDKVYKNKEHVYPYRESDELGGHDPYSASKAAAEIVISSYRDSFFNEIGISLASGRAGNVIGGGDWSKDRLIPDAIRAWQTGKTLEIRRPYAIRPWQHVLEPLAAYIKLAEKLWESNAFSGAYNFGPFSHESATVKDVISYAQKIYGASDVTWVNETEGPHEAGILALDISKARNILGIAPRWSLNETVSRTINWYTSWYKNANALDLCLKDITDYEKIL
jgi:CDP-glucose 4,6-dehydratase